MRKKAEIMNNDGINRALTRISHEILEKNNGASDLVIVGIKRGGVSLAKFIHQKIGQIEGKNPEYAELDTTLYRDDIEKSTVENKQTSSFQVNGKNIVLVDDVMFTGRTVRAAIDCIMDMGRPQCIRLAVLIDRGHRELPIRADYVGKNVPTSLDELIKVSTDESDGGKNVILYEK
ncbi:MAG: bifunctional pyr operon transcriptional regulator/uracil phosphoribosyltransferase PyrR [Clostridiales bacterium]|nr:bifunctional pyr operon transcriptional regulator/uracil phosphoribosyltransferase PyrR [Clostridiales bacterium]